jgi:dipeptide/tripeptide permease
MVGLSLGSLLLYVGTVAAGTAAAVVSLSLATGFASWCEGPFWASAIGVAGERVGAACAILNTGGNISGFLAPILTPYIASRAGWSWGLYAGSLMAIVGVVACYFVDPTGHKIGRRRRKILIRREKGIRRNGGERGKGKRVV